MIKKITAISLAAVLTASAVQAQTLKDLVNSVITKSTTSGNNWGSTPLNSLSNADITGALKQALQIGTNNASNVLSAQNGYFGNALVKILLPPEAVKVENTMRQLGMGKLVDNTILSMNRAAEDAAAKAAPIFINAITSMTITDGINIVKGGNGAATNYLRSKTTAELTTAFRPVIQQALGRQKVETYWNQLFTVYNNLPTTRNKVNTDLTAYVTERALAGLFLTITEEENKIRMNPAARVTDLLKKVFGSK